MNIQENSRYHEVHARSLADPEGFWAEAAREIDWIEPAKKIFDPDMGLYGRWFAGAVVNTCYNALDRHVAGGRADQEELDLAGMHPHRHRQREAPGRRGHGGRRPRVPRQDRPKRGRRGIAIELPGRAIGR